MTSFTAFPRFAVPPDRRNPVTIHEALAVLADVEAELHARGDRRGAFCAMYLIVTRVVAGAVVDRRGPFWDAPWISRLAGRFATRYLETLHLSTLNQYDCPAWRYAYRACEDGASPLRCAVLGLSAHIFADLPYGIAGLLAEEPELTAGRLALHKADHDAVNELLVDATGEVLATLATRYGCKASKALRAAPPALLLLGHAFLEIARWKAWSDAVALSSATPAELQHLRWRIRAGAASAGAVLSIGRSR